MKRLFDRDSNGSPLRIGDVLKLAKRDFNTEIDKNKLNYVLIGDPALKLAYPEHSIQVTRINGNSGEKNIEMIPGKNYTVRVKYDLTKMSYFPISTVIYTITYMTKKNSSPHWHIKTKKHGLIRIAPIY